MKVLPKILGAVLLLGCLAYISFVFGKYVLSSSLLKSIPKSERIISTDNPAPPNASAPASSQDEQNFSPQVEMRVLPNGRTSREKAANTGDTADSTSDSSDSNQADEDSKEPKKFDEGEASSPRHRRSRRSRKTENSDTSNAKSTAKATNSTSTKKSSTSSSAPIRRLNQVEKTEAKSPVPQPEKSTSAPSSSGDSANISPVPKPE
jgi:hypothetical protein